MKNHEDSYKYHLGFWTEKNHEHIFFNLTKLIYTHASGHVNFWDFKLVVLEKNKRACLFIKELRVSSLCRSYQSLEECHLPVLSFLIKAMVNSDVKLTPPNNRGRRILNHL